MTGYSCPLHLAAINEVLIDIIWRLISDNWFSMIINGDPYGYFHSSKGLRHGDPPSPGLFILVSEVLSRNLNRLHSTYPSVGYSTLSGCPIVSHLAFADDVIVFCNGSRNSLTKHKLFLTFYKSCSGQKVNVANSNFYMASGLSAAHMKCIASALGFAQAQLPILYLGCPLYFGWNTKQLFDLLVLKLQNKVNTWVGNFLNPAGRIILINHVLHSITTYQSAALNPQKAVIRQLDRFFATFFWGSFEGRNKSHWVSWDISCNPLEEGVLVSVRCLKLSKLTL